MKQHSKSEFPKQPRLWESMTVEEMRQILKKTKAVILPLGVTEQHGYHLPLCTDTLDAYETAKAVSAQTGAVVAPPLPYSFSGGELPGTINVSPQIMALMVQEIVQSIAQNGFRNIIILLGHGGSENFLALKDSLNLFLRKNRQYKDLLIAFAPVWEFGIWVDAFKSGDFHAGKVETSLVLHFAPQLVRKNRVVTDSKNILKALCKHPDNYQLVETLHGSPHVVRRISQRPDMKVGVMGYPRQAGAGLGRKIAATTITGISQLIRKIEKEKYKSYKEEKIKRGKLVITDN